MNYYQLTAYMQRRFRYNRKCSKCHKPISNIEQLCYTRSTYGKRVIYNFYHWRCFDEQAKSTTQE